MVALFMPFVGDAFFGDVEEKKITLTAQAVYMRLLWHSWKAGGPVRANDEDMPRLLRINPRTWRLIRPELEQFFEAEDLAGGTWRNVYLEDRRAEVAKRSKQFAELGQRSAAKRARQVANGKPRKSRSARIRRQLDGNSPGIARERNPEVVDKSRSRPENQRKIENQKGGDSPPQTETRTAAAEKSRAAYERVRRGLIEAGADLPPPRAHTGPGPSNGAEEEGPSPFQAEVLEGELIRDPLPLDDELRAIAADHPGCNIEAERRAYLVYERTLRVKTGTRKSRFVSWLKSPRREYNQPLAPSDDRGNTNGTRYNAAQGYTADQRANLHAEIDRLLSPGGD